MIEIRIHGRGGQGTVTACNLLASALLKENKWAQSFPLFGGERRGAAVQAFLRISGTSASEVPIIARGHIYRPDHLVLLDSRLMESGKDLSKAPGVLNGLKPGGWIIINSSKDPEAFDLADFRIATSDATGIAAAHHLGSVQSRPVSTAMVGAFSRVTGLVGLNSVLQAIREEVPGNTDQNAAAAAEAYQSVKMGTGE